MPLEYQGEATGIFEGFHIQRSESIERERADAIPIKWQWRQHMLHTSPVTRGLR